VNLTAILGEKRVIVAILLLITALSSVILGGIPLALFLSVFIYVGVGELISIAKAKSMDPPFYYIFWVAVILVGFASFELYRFILPFFAISVIFTYILILFRGKDARMNDISMTVLSIIYSGLFPIHIIMLRNINEISLHFLGRNIPLGLGLIVFMILVVAACDTGAFYIGKKFGKTPLWKQISPKKTVEGSIGGTIVGILVAVLVANYINLSLFHSFVAGFIISMAAQFGDLSESMIKREVGIKDSGNIFPGHGGVLDRSDSYVFTCVIIYYYFKFLIIPGI
jgi:phosphatidate cytidylyltransferase